MRRWRIIMGEEGMGFGRVKREGAKFAKGERILGELYRGYKTLQIKNTKLYTFEIFCQIIASANPVFESEMRFLGGFSCAILQLLRRGLH
jgi:hypothetical protein